jgi:hypothetical protein
VKFGAYFCMNDLRERGWNKTLVAALLGEPDQLKPNPWYRSSPPIRLYRIEKVKAVEESDDFKAHLKRRAKRSQAALKGVDTKKRKTVAIAVNVKIEIPELKPDELLERAVNNYNFHHAGYDNDYGKHVTVEPLAPWGVGAPSAFRDRICVNYLRHRCTSYDRILRYLTARLGREEAHRVLFSRIVEKIAEVYPALKAEAERQFESRWSG